MAEECHVHDWQTSPLLLYLKTLFDGPNFRTANIQVCKGCGLLRTSTKWAGYDTWEAAVDAANSPAQPAA
jgi:hypothetical protein